jgi:hypothetical protein
MRTVFMGTGVAVVLAAVAGGTYGCVRYRQFSRDMVDLAEALNRPHRPQVYDLEGNRIDGAETIDNGFVFMREPGDAGSYGVGWFSEYRDGKLVKTYHAPYMLPEPIGKKWREQMEQAERVDRAPNPYQAPDVKSE